MHWDGAARPFSQSTGADYDYFDFCARFSRLYQACWNAATGFYDLTRRQIMPTCRLSSAPADRTPTRDLQQVRLCPGVGIASTRVLTRL